MGKIGIVKDIHKETKEVVIQTSDGGFIIKTSYDNTYQSKSGKQINVFNMMNSVNVGDTVEFAEWQGKLKYISKSDGVPKPTSPSQPRATGSVQSDRLQAYLVALNVAVQLNLSTGKVSQGELFDVADEIFGSIVVRFQHLKGV